MLRLLVMELLMGTFEGPTMRTMTCADTKGPRMCAPLARNENENETKLSNHGGTKPDQPPKPGEKHD